MDTIALNTALPLSVTQEAMWVTWQFDPAKWEHVVPIALEVEGELELPRLRAAVAQLLERHPALLGRVVRRDEDVYLDWSGTSPQSVPVIERTLRCSREEALAAARVPFDLAAGPLARFEVLSGPDWTLLLITVHHITIDGASTPVLLDDLRRAYAGEQLPPAETLVPLAEHARRSRAAADGASGEPLRAYWREALGALPAARPLPTGTDRADAPLGLAVDAELTGRLRELARANRATYFIVTLGALFVALHHHTGSADLVVSAPYHGRDAPELKHRVGFFVNVLPFRQRIRPTDRYTDLLRELRTTVRDGLRQGALPLPSILRSAGLLGPDGRQQTHQVVFEYWDSRVDGGLDVFDFKMTGEHGTCSMRMHDAMDVPDYRLTVMLNERSDGNRMLWKDADGTVGEARTAALARDYLSVLADMVAAPERTLAEAVALLPKVAVRQKAAARVALPGLPAASPETLAAVAAVWTEVLRVPDLAPEDTFFGIGGHSLLAPPLLARLKERLGVKLTVRNLFERPSLGEVASMVDDARRRAAQASPVPRSEQGDGAGVTAGDTFPASRFQEAIWLAERLDPAHARYHIPLSWRVRGAVDPARLRAALARLTERHEILRTRFVDRDGRLVQEIGAPWQPEPATFNGGPAQWFEQAAADFRPADGRLIAAALGTGADGEQVLALCVHHLVLDGESVPLLLRELDRCYRAEQLPPAPQYRELVQSQQSGAGRELAAADVEHRAAALAGAPSTVGPERLTPGAPSGTVALPLAADLAERLRDAQVSQFTILATALAATLHRWSGQSDLTFGVPLADRAGGDFAEVLGPCLNTVVLRSQCAPGTTVGELLRETRERVLDAFDHRSAPFDELVRRLRPARTAGRTPYLDCLLNSVGTTGWSTALGDADLVSLDHELRDEGANKFGLTVTFGSHGERLLGTLAYRGGYLEPGAAALAEDLARLLNHFHDLGDEPVFGHRAPEES
ncbi:condensation domain-containing protein [Kitasatospora viridis]|uniref:Phosphopantetheine binding protein n=1 Tax=Kitasatospora viridis TaxID=281105 RepID=A0A561UC05_9ACTN|nr:condensation domain-containing protein [Kitasatospora viridis]TWF96897.1 phosphopantetheine binding protein [Kitasatospora viridis]